MWRTLVAICLLPVIGCARSGEVTDYDPPATPQSFPLSETVKDERPVFRIDPDQPYRIELGRGSGWHGLETIKITQDGRVAMSRQKHHYEENVTVSTWETATIQLSPEAVAEVLEAVETHGLMKLHRSYSADVADGTQWVLWIKQGESEKSVYFDNHFPRSICRFAARLDEIIAANSHNVMWKPTEVSYDRELWESIKR